MKNFFNCFFLFLGLLHLPDSSIASNVLGGGIEYQQLGHDSFKVTVKIYKDCKSISFIPSVLKIVSTSGNCNWQVPGDSLTQIGCEDVTPVCKKSCSKCDAQNCNGNGYPNGSNSSCSFQYGIEKLTYQYILVFPTQLSNACCKFRIEYEQCCRPSNVTTCCANDVFYTYAELDRCLQGPNSSPVFANDPFFILCTGSCFCLNLAARDTFDFDSLSYQLDRSLTSFGTPAIYNPPYSSTSPILFKGFPSIKPYPQIPCSGFILDSITGDLCFTPVQQQIANLVINVNEWRTDTLTGKKIKVGRVRMDAIVIVNANCDNRFPKLMGPYSNIVCSGDSINFLNMDIQDVDTLNGSFRDSVFVDWNHAIPGAAFSTYWLGTRQKWNLKWLPDDSILKDHRIHTFFFTVTARDNHCPNVGISARSYAITVVPRPRITLSENFISCNEYQFQASSKFNYHGNESYSWVIPYPGGKVYNTSGFHHKFNLSGRTPIYMSCNIGACTTEFMDTISVLPFTYFSPLSDTSVCLGTDLTLYARTKSVAGSLKYLWNNDSSYTDSFIDLKIYRDTTIRLFIHDTLGCSYTDSCRIKVLPLPKIDLGPDVTFCEGDSALLDAGDNQGKGVMQYHWWDLNQGIQLDSNRYHVCYQSKYLAAEITDSFRCKNTDTVTITVNPLPLPNAGPDLEVCIGDSVQINTNTVSGHQYKWTPVSNLYQPAPPPFMLYPKGNNTYILWDSVETTGCKNQDTMQVIVNPLPLKPTITVSGKQLYSSADTGNVWYLNGTLTHDTSKYITPLTSGNYRVKVTNAYGCENYSDSVYFNYVNGISIPERLNLSVYPNPFGEGFYLETNRTVQIEILDIAGRRLRLQNLPAGNIYIETESWSAGIYILRAEGNIYKLSKNE